MSQSCIEYPATLPASHHLHEYLTSSEYLTNIIWKIAFSPCSQYLAIPKQDIYGRYCVLVLKCSDWNTHDFSERFPFEHQFFCSAAVWSLTFAQSRCPSSSLLGPDAIAALPALRDPSIRRRSSVSVVNRRYDLTKNLFLAAGLADGKINIWNIQTGELTLILKDHGSTVCGLDLSSSTMQLASSSCDKTIKLWNLLDDGNMYKTLKDWEVVINTVKWSPDETMLCAVGPHELVVLYDTRTWKELLNLKRHLNTVADCAFSSDSALLLTASHDTRVYAWSTLTGELLREYAHVLPVPLSIYAGGDNGSFVRSLTITKNNQMVITVCDDNKIRWFPLLSERSNKVIFERIETNALCVTTTANGLTTAVSTRNGEVHLLSPLSTTTTRTAPSLKFILRLKINSQLGYQRQKIFSFPLAQHLINYLAYKDIRVK